jgi:hypothetical protein
LPEECLIEIGEKAFLLKWFFEREEKCGFVA